MNRIRAFFRALANALGVADKKLDDAAPKAPTPASEAITAVDKAGAIRKKE